jgi:N-acetylated-alpha-linked acidic dipeptidase
MTTPLSPMLPPFLRPPGLGPAGLAPVILLALSGALVPGGLSAQTPTGFTPGGAANQAMCEARLQELPTPEAWREHHRIITREPHPTGSEAQRRVGEYLAQVMEAAGLEVQRAEYDVYLPQLDGMVNEVEIATPVRKRLENREAALAEDPESSHPDLLPGWNAYSGSGDVTGEVVYANFGRKEDFEELAEMGVEVAGKVVIARYGGNFRGFKVKFAEEWGAIGVIMFNDPGFAGGDEYPAGPQMNASTIQRGSALTLDWTGDPLTPFEPALPLDGDVQVDRLDPAEVAFHTIPVLPIGYGAAQEILELMEGDPVPGGWGGGLPITYRLTGGDALTVRVNVQQRLDYTRATNIIGTIEGSEFPDEWVILGSHYDPWSFGAHDPNGGTTTLVQLAEALGQLVQEGCRPRRSILIAHWDAEEYGIIGSTEWVEHYLDDLDRNAVAYINADGAVTGQAFSSSSSPSLKGPIIEAAGAVQYPGIEGSVLDWWVANSRGTDGPAIGNLGGGSDHVGFYTHAGIPSAGLSFGGSNGIYHSNYDTFTFFERFSDPTWRSGPALARVDGVLALRLANADVIPYDVVRYATDVATHATGLETMGEDLGMEVELTALKRAAAGVEEAARAFVATRDARLARGPLGPREADAVNGALLGLERAFLHDDGLQGRPWSRSLYASPDPFSGYASWMLPGIRYEIATGNAAGVPTWEAIYVGAMQELETRIRGATEALGG